MLIKAENLHKVYRDGKRSLSVLKGIDIFLDSGSISAIIGPSGAGKSTLLHILGGLDRPTEGKVFFDDIDLYGITDSRLSLIRNKRIGFIFQFYHLLAEFTALENVIIPGLIGSLDGKKSLLDKAKELLGYVGLKERINHKPSELSGGEAQRVAIARALINEPEIVFCDEPTGNLDSENSEIILRLIRDLNKNKKQTFLIVTHNEKAIGFAEKILHIKDGLLV
jgi:ABC-type lipoprotein export system ATPase subunit